MKTRSHGVIAATLFLGGLIVGSQSDNFYTGESAQSSSELSRLVTHQSPGGGTQDFGALAERLSPSVVHISVKKSTTNTYSPGASGQGSGVIISSDGEILTNHHVIAGASSIVIRLADGQQYDAKVLGTDSQTDLALIKVKNTSNLPSAQLGDSEKIGVGDWVMAIGNPFGLDSTVTVGVLSGKSRVIGAGPYDDFLQTDASINPGNSGGPLFNTKGEVVGINTAIIRDGQGIGFSIPINLAKRIAAELRTEGIVERGFLGVGVQALDARLRRGLKMEKGASGALVSSVSANGPAHEAGLEPGDLIYKIGETQIKTDRDLLSAVADLPVGRSVTVYYLREGSEYSTEVALAKRPSPEEKVSRRVEAPDQKLRLGVQLAPTASGQGVRLSKVFSGSTAWRSGLLQGDVILELGSTEIVNPEQFLGLLNNTPPNEVALLISRNGTTYFVVVDEG